MSKYEYRLVFLEFNGQYREGEPCGQMTFSLEPGERVFTTFGQPEVSNHHLSGDQTYFLPAMIEKEVGPSYGCTTRPATPEETEELNRKLRSQA